MSRLRRVAGLVRDLLLSAGAALGLLVLVAMVVGLAVGVRPVVITSGSMEPSIGTGALVLSRTVPASDVEVGDVVTVRSPTGSRVTHRVVDVARDGDLVVLRLKGDANPGADPMSYPASEVGEALVHVPYVGYALMAVRTPVGLVVLGGLVMLLVLVAVRGSAGRREPPPGRHAGGTPGGHSSGSSSGHRAAQGARRRARGRRTAVAAATAAVVAATPGVAQAAPWTDDVAVSGSSFTAYTLPAPTLSCGGLGVLSVTFNWTAVAGATGYELTAGGTTYPVQATTSRTIVAAITGGTATVRALRDFGSTTWTSVASNQRTYTVAVVSLCS